MSGDGRALRAAASVAAAAAAATSACAFGLTSVGGWRWSMHADSCADWRLPGVLQPCSLPWRVAVHVKLKGRVQALVSMKPTVK